MDPQPYRPAGVDAGYRVDVLYFRVQYVGVYSHRPVERHRGRFRDYRGPGRIVDYGLCLGRGAGFAAVDARGSEDGVPAADARGAGAFHCEPRVVRTFVFLCDADGFADRCGLCACGVLVDRFAAGGPRRTEGSAIGCIGIDYHGNVDCHDRRSAAGSRDRTLRGMADDLLLHCCGRGGRLAVSGGDLSPGPEPRHHFAAQGAFPAGKPRPRGRLCADRSHGNGPLYGVQLHRTVPGTGGRAGQRLDNLGADGVRVGGDRRKPVVFARL